VRKKGGREGRRGKGKGKEDSRYMEEMGGKSDIYKTLVVFEI
jgi:hypothetical protein